MRKSKTAVGQLQIIKDLYKDKDHWTQGDYQSYKGNKLCYCLTGAAIKTEIDYTIANEVKCMSYLSKAIKKISKKASPKFFMYEDVIIHWNDAENRTITDIRKAVNLALKLAKKDEAKAA